MTMYDPENPQHGDYLARAKAASQRTTAAEIAERIAQAEERTTGMSEALRAAAIHWANKEAAR